MEAEHRPAQLPHAGEGGAGTGGGDGGVDANSRTIWETSGEPTWDRIRNMSEVWVSKVQVVRTSGYVSAHQYSESGAVLVPCQRPTLAARIGTRWGLDPRINLSHRG